MLTHAALGTALLLAFAAPTTWPEPDDKEKDRLFKLFVDELTPLTPGKGKFPASFTMGSEGDGFPATEKPAVKVTFAHDFAVSRYEVTQELYRAVVGKNPATWKGPRNSVEMVSWDDANEFCAKLTAELRKRKLIKETEEIRLPSEAEWEYACRAGTTTRYGFGDKAAELKDYSWYDANSKGEDPPVGKKKPNDWGLYDMHGYVWEWTADVWSDSHKGADASGKARAGEGKGRVARGGAFNSPADSVRSAAREERARDFRNDAVGFRCVRAAVKARE
jgi:formylglycine-generating enzyme required for sulfatase activity